MPIYNFEAVDKRGKTETGQIEIGSEDEAVSDLRKRGLFVSDIKLVPLTKSPTPSTTIRSVATSESAAKYRWNGFQKAAFICWGVGALMILSPIAALVAFAPEAIESIIVICIVIFAGVVLLATGGTLHQIGSGRERI